MRSLIVITVVLLCSRSCVSVFQTVEVQSGKNVTLLCSDFTTNRGQTDWFRMVNSSKVSCISSMFGSDGDPSFCPGFKDGKFAMSSNSSFVSLKISGVNESDSGLYFCGFYIKRHTVLGDVTQLIIKGDESNDKVKDFTDSVVDTHSSHWPGILTVSMAIFTAAALGLVVVFRHCCAAKENLHTENMKTPGSSDLNSAALMLPKSQRSGQAAESRELETCVMYSLRRQSCCSV